MGRSRRSHRTERRNHHYVQDLRFPGSISRAAAECPEISGGVEHDIRLIKPEAIVPIQDLKVRFLGGRNPRLHTDEVLIALTLAACSDENAENL